MKYKVLITGKNTTIIDDFFVHMDDHFEVLSTSTRFGDIIRHTKYFNPDLFVYCLGNESRESISQMNNIKHSSFRTKIPVIVLGSKEECDEFEKIAVNVANLVLTKPFTTASIQEDILKFLEEREEYFQNGEKKRENIVSEKDVAAEKSDETENAAKKTEAASAEEKVHAETAEDEATSAEAEKSSIPSEDPSPSAVEEPAQRKHILVVDDDPLMLKMLKDHLHNEFDVATAVSGKIAIKFLERKKTNLILLDYEMPGETGPEVLEKIRANNETKDIPVVFLTGVSEREKIQEALGLRPQGYLLKPIDHEKLLDTIKKVIR